MNKKVFMSYTMADKQIAETLAKDLNERGISTFMDSRDLKTGENWEENIKEEIQSASYFVAVLSENSIGSKQAMQELGAALVSDIQIVPIIIGHPKIPFNLLKYQHLDLSNGDTKRVLEKFRQTVI